MTSKERTEYNREYKRMQRAARVAQGLCPDCGVVVSNKARTHCYVCLEQQAECQRTKRDLRIAKGQCIKCANPNGNGKRHCDKCLPLLNLCWPAPDAVKRATVAQVEYKENDVL